MPMPLPLLLPTVCITVCQQKLTTGNYDCRPAVTPDSKVPVPPKIVLSRMIAMHT
jgi:hypothetical protein